MMEKGLYYYDINNYYLKDSYKIIDYDFENNPTATFEDIFEVLYTKNSFGDYYVNDKLIYILCFLDYRPGTQPETPIIIKYDYINNKLIDLMEVDSNCLYIKNTYFSYNGEYLL